MNFLRTAMVIAALVTCVLGQSTEITYQGQLQSSSAPASGNFDFEFALFESGGSQIGPVLTRNGVAVAGGVFSVNLDFGSGFPGAPRFLEIRVRQSGGGAFTTLSPRQPVTSTPYSIKNLTADSADNASNALTATNFLGNLAGDVTGTQSNNKVVRLQNQNVSSMAPLNGQVLKFNSTTGQWTPDTDNTGSGGGGGTITGVTAGTGLTGGGATGNVTLGIGPGGVGTGQLAEGSVVDSKIVTVSGGKVVGTVANATNAINATNANTANTAVDATNAANATNAQNLGGVPANQYLQANGNGSGLTNLNASNITSGTLSNARLGQIPTANIADSAVTSAKIATGQVVKTLNGLTDNVSLAAGSNITITPSGNTLTIASTGGGGLSGSGTANVLPMWTGPSALGNSVITQSGSNIGIGNSTPFARLDVDSSSNVAIRGVSTNGVGIFGISTSGTGVYGNAAIGDAGLFDGRVRVSGNLGIGTSAAGTTDKLTVQTPTSSYGVVHTDGTITLGSFVGGSTGGGWFGTRSNHPLSFFANNSSPIMTIGTNGNVGIGTTTPSAKLAVIGTGVGVSASSENLEGVLGNSTNGTGVVGLSTGGIGIRASSGGVALRTNGTSFFKGDTTPLSAANAGSGTGIAIGSAGTLGYISSFDYGLFQPRTLLLDNSGGNVGINTNSPDQALSVNGNASKVGGGSWLAFSDERLKNIKGRFHGGLKAVMKLQPMRYEYKTDNAIGLRSEGQHVGFSAQAVEKVIPEAVTETEEGYRLVNNDPIIFAMLNAIKEQQAMIEKLNKTVERLQRAGARKKVSKRRQ